MVRLIEPANCVKTMVGTREPAEENGYDILGPAENVPPGRDAVRVAADSIDTV